MNVSDGTDSDDDNIDAEEIADGGEESGKPNNQESPFFTGNDNSKVLDTDDDLDMEDENKAKPDEEEEDDLIKALKAAKEIKVRNSPPDIKTSGLITDSANTASECIKLFKMGYYYSIHIPITVQCHVKI